MLELLRLLNNPFTFRIIIIYAYLYIALCRLWEFVRTMIVLLSAFFVLIVFGGISIIYDLFIYACGFLVDLAGNTLTLLDKEWWTRNE